MTKPILLVVCTTLPFPLQAALIDMWTFNDVPLGAVAGDGSVSSTGVNGGLATIRGAGVSSVNIGGSGINGIDLPGGSSASQGYMDLANGIISSRTDLTVNTWMSIHSLQAWQRVFDFGKTTGGVGGELFGPGGGGQGEDYILLAPNRGTNPSENRLDAYINFVGRNTTDSNAFVSLGAQHLFTFVWDDLGGGQSTQAWYLDGNLVAQSVPFTMTLSEIEDVNNWLGRSNWTGDANTDGTYDEFALYDHAMNAGQVTAAFAAGPIPEPSGTLMLAGSLLGLMARRRRV